MSEHTIIPIRGAWTQVIRWWARQPLSSNPLLRPSDRLEAALRIVATVAVLVAVPVAGALGTAAYDASVTQIKAENATKHSVVAVLAEEPTSVGAHRYQARVRWVDSDRSGSAVVPVPRGQKADGYLILWLDPDGAPTTEPRKPVAATMTGIGVGVVVLVSTWLAGWCLVHGTGWLLDGLRSAQWAHEWRQFGRPIKEDRQ